MMEPTLEETPQESGFRFSTRKLLWAVTLLGVGMGTFGPWLGMYLVIVVILCQIRIVARRSTPSQIVTLAVGLLVFHLLIIFLWDGVETATSAYHRTHSMTNLKQIGLSLHNYHDKNGHFPKPFTISPEGKRLHGWRTQSLPYLNELALYQKIDFNKAWNHPVNQSLNGGLIEDIFCSPQDRQNKTDSNYLAIVDEATVWDPNSNVSFKDVTDGISNTIVLIEVLGKEIPWYEPRDLTLEEAINILVGDVHTEWLRPGFFTSERIRGDGLAYRHVCYADGVLGLVGKIESRKDALALLTKSSGEELRENWRRKRIVRNEEVVGYIIHWGRIGSTLLFVVLAICPLWQRKARRADSE